MKLFHLLCYVFFPFVISSEPSDGLNLLLQASEIVTESAPRKRVRFENSTSAPPILRLNMSSINLFENIRFLQPDGPLKRTRYHRDHVLPMGESITEFSASTNFFESRIPRVIREFILNKYLGHGQRPRPDGWLVGLTDLLNRLNFTDTDLVRQYTQYLSSFLYMNEGVHLEISRINKMREHATASAIASRARDLGNPSYITTERIFEWYKCLFTGPSYRDVLNGLHRREDEFGNSLVNIPVITWTDCFIKPRLDRLRRTYTEKYSE